MGYGDLPTDPANKLLVSVRKRHSQDEVLPQGSVLLTRDEVLKIQMQLVQNWIPKTEM